MVFVPVQYHRLCELEPESERDSDFFRVSEDAFEAVSPLAVVLPVSEYEALFFVSLSLFGIEFTEPYGGLIRFILSRTPHGPPGPRGHRNRGPASLPRSPRHQRSIWQLTHSSSYRGPNRS